MDSGSHTVTLDKPVPVYLVYFTARVDDDGRLVTFGDIYGNDDRVMSALRGHPVRYTAPEAIDPDIGGDDQPEAVSDAGSDDLQDVPRPTKKPTKSKQTAADGEASFQRTANDIDSGCAGEHLPELTPIDLCRRNKRRGPAGPPLIFRLNFRCALMPPFRASGSICRVRRGYSSWRGA